MRRSVRAGARLYGVAGSPQGSRIGRACIGPQGIICVDWRPLCADRRLRRYSSSSPADVRPTRAKQSEEEKERAEIYDSIIRVNQAGEFGAQQIYKGQLAVLRGTAEEPIIQHMADQEQKHLRAFQEMMVKHRVRPTAFTPIWEAAGWMLGAGTALLGKEAAMACTVAVETVIGDHYNDQLRLLNEKNCNNEEDKELRQMIKEFRDEELEHLDIGLEHEAEKAPLYGMLTTAVQTGSKVAIWLSKRW